MRSWPVRLGVLLGLVATVTLAPLAAQRAHSAVPAHGRILSDADGALSEIVIQYVSEAAPVVERAYGEFLSRLPGDVRVRVVCRSEHDYADLLRRLPEHACRLAPVYTGHPMTCWSRDRWLAFEPRERGAAVLVVSPRIEDGEAVWPLRAGDKKIGEDLARDDPSGVRAWRSPLAFDGGDFVADEETAFVSPRVARRNIGITVASRDELLRELEALLKRRIVLLDEAPDHHAGMYMMLAGARTAVVGDPAWGRRLLGEAGARAPIEADFSAVAQGRFDAVASQCTGAGYRVVRVPVVPGRDGRTYVTYLNAILDERPAGRTIYMPVFRGAGVLNDAAAGVWRDLGYRVVRVDCSDAYTSFGSLRCLVNVLRRKDAGSRELEGPGVGALSCP